MENKVCNKCNIERPIEHFPKDKNVKMVNGRYVKCVNGKLPMTKDERKEKRNIIKTQKYKLSEKSLKPCYRCIQVKNLTEFNFCNGSPNATYIECQNTPMTNEQDENYLMRDGIIL